MDLPKTFDEFVDARKQGFIRAKEFKDNGGKLAGCQGLTTCRRAASRRSQVALWRNG